MSTQTDLDTDPGVVEFLKRFVLVVTNRTTGEEERLDGSRRDILCSVRASAAANDLSLTDAIRAMLDTPGLVLGGFRRHLEPPAGMIRCELAPPAGAHLPEDGRRVTLSIFTDAVMITASRRVPVAATMFSPARVSDQLVCRFHIDRSPDAIAMAREVYRGLCDPAVFADWCDDHHDLCRGVGPAGPTARETITAWLRECEPELPF